MESGSLHPSRPSAQRQRSNTTVPNATSSNPPADLSDPKKPSHRHHHSHHHLPRHHGKDSQIKRLQQIATLDSRSGYAASLSTNGSRRGSFTGAESGREDKLAAPTPVKPEDLAREKQRINNRNTELRSTLKSLSEQSLKATRDLDDVYYSILDKLSILRSTVSNLQELSTLTRHLHEGFQRDAQDLETEMEGQINEFGEFKAQSESIQGFETRMRDSKTKVDTLSERLEKARSRVQKLEETEGNWQAAVSRRIKMMWMIFGTVAALVIGLLVSHSYHKSSGNLSNPSGPVAPSAILSSMSTAETPSPKDILHEMYDNLTTHTDSTEQLTPSANVQVEEEDPRLQIFEEL